MSYILKLLAILALALAFATAGGLVALDKQVFVQGVNAHEEDEEDEQDEEEMDEEDEEDEDEEELDEEQTREGLRITPSGETLLTGALVESINGTTLQVSVWGIDFQVDASQARVKAGKGGESSLSNIQVGHRLFVEGMFDRTTGVITAEVIVDHSLRGLSESAIENIRARIEQLFEKLRELQEKLQERLQGLGLPGEEEEEGEEEGEEESE